MLRLVLQVHEIHNETLCSVTSYLDGTPLGQDGAGAAGAGGNEGQHPYDTSPHAQENQNEARSSAIGGTIVCPLSVCLDERLALMPLLCGPFQVIEIHNETRLIENRYFSSKSSRTADEPVSSKRKQPSSVKVKKGTTVGLCLAEGRPRHALADDLD